MEMLPALALFACIAGAAVETWLKRRVGEKAAGAVEKPSASVPKAAQPAQIFLAAAIVLVMLNPVAMIFGADAVQKIAGVIERHPSHLLTSYSPPLVLKEALVNSTTRVPFERSVALVLNELPAGAPILMQESDHIGALEDAGIPLKQTINETDYDSWHAALEDPASHALFVIAMEGDAVSKAVAAHPQELQELDILCTTGQPCAHIYRSLSYGAKNAAGYAGKAIGAGAQGGSPAK